MSAVRSDRYVRDLDRIGSDIETARREGLSLPRLVWRARSAYREAWRREVLRYRETRPD